ncbi:hypothetical protein C8Q76DRAFT_575436, partial [Earliella scabrosa]
LTQLLNWRRVSRALYAEVTAVLRQRLSTILRPFFPDPAAFLRHLTEFGAVVGGIAALSFLLQDSTVRCDVLQVFVGRDTYEPFVMRLGSCPANSDEIVAGLARAPPRQFGAERDIAGMTTLRLRSGRCVMVYKASAASGCSTLTRSPSTALMNFISEHTFACAYPSLTFRRRALLCDVRISTRSDVDYAVLAALLRAGFQFAPHAAVWPEYRATPVLHAWDASIECLRDQYICPQQTRYFGDRGSLTNVVDPI